MSRFDAKKLYIIKKLHTSATPEAPVSAKSIAEYLCEQNIISDESTVLRETALLQSSEVPILCSEANHNCF
ncbi:MAG TPA: hypothetical protein DCG49_04670, partial [Ruminococcus sp.]|nr:hypothetical protein [Ruminococcus sp.]